MTTRNGLRSGLASVFVLALGLTGCALEGDGGISEDAVEFGFDEVNAPLPSETVRVDFRTGRAPRYLDEGDNSGPCECDSAQCVDDWVVVNFGCNVCVEYVCDAFSGHSCNVCEEPAPNDDQRWQHDGTRAE